MYSKNVIFCFVLAMVILFVTALFIPSATTSSASPFVKGGNLFYQEITIQNNQKHVGGPFDLRCRGYHDGKYMNHKWSASVTVNPRSNASLTFPLIEPTQQFEIYCTYYSKEGCRAHRFLLFQTPGNDNYFCNNRRPGGCIIDFQSDGSVNKLYGKVETISLGIIPTKDNVKDRCWRSLCIPDIFNQVIGEDSCCDNSCGKWDPLL